MENKTPIEILTGALAEMTTRAMNAERELAETKRSEDTWYQLHQNQKVEIEKLRDELDKVKKENETLQSKLDDLKEENAALQDRVDYMESATVNLKKQLEIVRGCLKQ